MQKFKRSFIRPMYVVNGDDERTIGNLLFVNLSVSTTIYK